MVKMISDDGNKKPCQILIKNKTNPAHYFCVHFTIVDVKVSTWRLSDLNLSSTTFTNELFTLNCLFEHHNRNIDSTRAVRLGRDYLLL